MSETEQRQMQYLPIGDIEFAEMRDIRPNVVSDIEDRIEESGYNPARPLRVVKRNGGYVVADGNHRLETIHQMGGFETVPCVIEPEDADMHAVAVEANRDEDAYAEMDLFDWLDIIGELRDDHAQAGIGEKIGWTRNQVARYVGVLENIVPEVLDSARQHQEGRGTDDVPNGTFDFTEGWFRNSGLYDLSDAPYFQQWFMAWFALENNCNPGKQKAASKIERLCDINEQASVLDAELNAGVDNHEATALESAVLRGEHSKDSLQDTIESLNEGAKDRTYFGHDAVDTLAEFDDNEFACVVTDPPYGVGYENFRDNDRPDFGENAPDALGLLYDVLEECERVCKANAHLYVFFPTRLYAEAREVMAEFFEVRPVPILWVKNNHAPTQDTESGFEQMYAQQYETLFHLRAEKADSRPLNGSVSPNVLEYDTPKGDDERWHDSQKPTGVWGELITNSTGTGETVLDPFAGSGSSLLAAAETGRHYVGIEKSDEYESRFKRELRALEGGGSDE